MHCGHYCIIKIWVYINIQVTNIVITAIHYSLKFHPELDWLYSIYAGRYKIGALNLQLECHQISFYVVSNAWLIIFYRRQWTVLASCSQFHVQDHVSWLIVFWFVSKIWHGIKFLYPSMVRGWVHLQYLHKLGGLEISCFQQLLPLSILQLSQHIIYFWLHWSMQMYLSEISSFVKNNWRTWTCSVANTIVLSWRLSEFLQVLKSDENCTICFKLYQYYSG